MPAFLWFYFNPVIKLTTIELIKLNNDEKDLDAYTKTHRLTSNLGMCSNRGDFFKQFQYINNQPA